MTMHLLHLPLLLHVLLLLLLLLTPPTDAAGRKLNVLLIVCDDLRPELGAYNHSHMITPHLDRLAATSLLFERAFTNYAYCSPSRNSFMSGRMPGTSKVFNFLNSFRDPTVRDRAGLPGTQVQEEDTTQLPCLPCAVIAP